MDTVNLVKEMGVVGAGGAGFPTHVKLQSKASTVLVNAAECEPLLHKDKQLLRHKSEPFFKGLTMVMEAVEAGKGIIGIKKKHTALIDFLAEQLPPGVEICAVDDFYPAGDEITLIRETTGLIIEPGKLPVSQGILVSNVESLYNIGKNRPVTTKFVNLGGCVRNLHTLEVPLGITFQELLDYASPTIGEYAVIEGGPMMGKVVSDFSQVVTKTTAALLVLPSEHVLIRKYTDMAVEKRVNSIGKAACDQCSICTELCPRYLLGHPIQPHVAMRSLVFFNEEQGEQPPQAHTLYCCQCNLCSFVSCPEGLYPSQVCILNRQRSIAEKHSFQGSLTDPPHPLAEYRKTPSKRLRIMLDLNRFEDKGALEEHTFQPAELTMLLRQHIGGAAEPVVQIGDSVQREQKIATMGESLGSELYSPVDGKVVEVTEDYIRINAEYATK